MTEFARHTDPSTSHRAAPEDDALTRLQMLVVECLEQHPSGLTVPEIATILSLPRDTVSPRMKTLVAQGRAHDTGFEKIPPRHRRHCIIWCAGLGNAPPPLSRHARMKRALQTIAANGDDVSREVAKAALT